MRAQRLSNFVPPQLALSQGKFYYYYCILLNNSFARGSYKEIHVHSKLQSGRTRSSSVLSCKRLGQKKSAALLCLGLFIFQISRYNSKVPKLVFLCVGLLDVRICQYYCLVFGRRTALQPVGCVCTLAEGCPLDMTALRAASLCQGMRRIIVGNCWWP